ncbi:hypothetical protein CPAV1605_849 [seawater metagenome]|uniref:Uncharacterized protein n=1 Tax=seawater metagenome TaxID=1561972 RepID=A0A5E8CKB9_9ZZZZ
MNKIKSSIQKSKIWSFNRKIIVNDKVSGQIPNGTITWLEIEPNIYSYCESGQGTSCNINKNFLKYYKFIFEGDKYTVYKQCGRIFYTSNSNNRAVTLDYDNIYYITLNETINGFAMEIISDSNAIVVKTNYYLK